jgi:hypothetical protein
MDKESFWGNIIKLQLWLNSMEDYSVEELKTLVTWSLEELRELKRFKESLEEKRFIYLDQEGRLSISYAKSRWTKKESIYSLELRPSCGYGDLKSSYQENVVWQANHNKKYWVWYQPLKRKHFPDAKEFISITPMSEEYVLQKYNHLVLK